MRKKKVNRTPALNWEYVDEDLSPHVNKYAKEFDRTVLPVTVLGLRYDMVFWRNGKPNPPLERIGPVTLLSDIYQFYRYDTTIVSLTIKTLANMTVAQYIRKGNDLVSVY
jgi:hypothetical protein